MPVDEKKTDESVNDQMKKLTDAVKSSGDLQKLLAIPEIQEVLKAQQAGQKINIVPADALPLDKKETEDKKDDQTNLSTDEIDMLSNSEMMRVINANIGGSLKGVLDEALAPFKDQLTQLADRAKSQDEERIASEVSAVEKQFPDFEERVPMMKVIHGQNPGLTVEELYHMARMRMGDKPYEHEETSSERPTNVFAAIMDKRTARSDDSKTRLGPRGFEAMTKEAMERVAEKHDI